MIGRLLRWWRGRREGDRGAWGERQAESYLRCTYDFRSVARNWRNPRDLREEIDLVMLDREVLVFIEVKTRSAAALVPGYHAVTPKKKRILRRACKAYLRRLSEAPRTFRFDIVEVETGGEGAPGAAPVVRHFANVPLFAKGFRP